MSVDLDITDPGLPTYVEGDYVDPSYQVYEPNPHFEPSNPSTVPTSWLPGSFPPFVLAAPNSLQGVPFEPPSTPAGFPSGPTTLPPMGSPTGNSSWAAGPTDITGDEMGYSPPAAIVVDDGLTFPAHMSDLILENQWHGIPSTLNPGNLELYNNQLQTTILEAIASAQTSQPSGGFIVLPAGAGDTSTVSVPVPPNLTIEQQVQAAIISAVMQGSNLWYELVLKPVTNGPFAGSYVVNTLPLALPLGVDLTASSPGRNQP